MSPMHHNLDVLDSNSKIMGETQFLQGSYCLVGDTYKETYMV